jgi:ABC-type spermidine/putrescine transport system permease subunit II
VLFAGFAVIPLVGVFLLSFTTWDGIGTLRTSGLDSWRAVLADPGLPHAVWLTFPVMLASWAVQTPLSSWWPDRRPYNALTIWNGFLLPLTLTQSPEWQTLPLALSTFQGQHSINVPAIVAAIVLTTLPILVLYAFGRRQLLTGTGPRSSRCRST